MIKLQRKQTPRKSRKRLLLPLCPPVQGTSQVCRSLSMRGYDHMTSCDWLLHTLHVYGCRVSRIVKPGNVKDTQKYVWSHICCYLLFYFLYKLLKKVDVISYCIFNQNRKKCVFHLWKKCFICLLYSNSLKYLTVFTYLCNIFISIKVRLSFCIDNDIKHFWELVYSYSI